VYISQGSERFTDFCSKPARLQLGGFIRLIFYPPVVWWTGGMFSVKVVVIKRNANQSLSVTKAKAFHFVFPEIFTRLGRGLLI